MGKIQPMIKVLTVLLISLVNFYAYAQCTQADTTMLYADKGKTPAWPVGKNMPLIVLKSDKLWANVKAVDGYSYWVKKNQLSKKNLKCVVVKLEKVNLRVGPSTKKALHKFRIADKYTSFKVVLSQKSWLFVESHLGFKAWVSKAAVWPPIK